jgi:hypothetical protein
LVPASGFILLVAVGVGIAGADAFGITSLIAFASMASLQIGYLIGVGIRYALAAARMSAFLAGSKTARRGAH